jgi:predicted transcriptional regulator
MTKLIRGLTVTPSDTLEMTAEVVAAFVANNSLPTGELPELIQTVHATLTKLNDGTQTPAAEEPTKAPAVSIRRSVTPEYLICLEDGKHFKSMKRHLAAHGLTPDQYRAKWKLPSDYPMVASNYAAKRSALAKKSGLGQVRSGAGTGKRGRPAKV